MSLWQRDSRPGLYETIAIGGIADGETIRGERSGFRHFKLKPVCPSLVDSLTPVASLPDFSIYQLRTLSIIKPDTGQVYSWSVFVDADVKASDFAIMDRLIQCYRPVKASLPVP